MTVSSLVIAFVVLVIGVIAAVAIFSMLQKGVAAAPIDSPKGKSALVMGLYFLAAIAIALFFFGGGFTALTGYPRGGVLIHE